MWRSVERGGLALAAALVAWLAFGGSALADKATELTARQDFAAGRYDEAMELFAKLYAETLHPVYLRNIGRCHQKMREPQKAIDAFHDYLAKDKKVSADERAEIEGYIKEMESLRDEQAAQAATQAHPTPPPPAVAPLPVAPPPPTSGTAVTLASPPPPPARESPIYKKWWFWTAVGVVAAGGVVGAVALWGGSRPPCTAAQCL